MSALSINHYFLHDSPDLSPSDSDLTAPSSSKLLQCQKCGHSQGREFCEIAILKEQVMGGKNGKSLGLPFPAVHMQVEILVCTYVGIVIHDPSMYVRTSAGNAASCCQSRY